MRSPMHIVRVLTRGVAAGILGTASMTLVHVLLSRLATHEQTLAPSFPERLIHRFGSKTGTIEAIQPQTSGEIVAIAHFAYGGFWGLLYALVQLIRPTPPYLAGPLWGGVSWVAGFVGWLPLIRHLPPPWRRPPGRVLSGLISHWAYGLGGAAAYSLLSPSTTAWRGSGTHTKLRRKRVMLAPERRHHVR